MKCREVVNEIALAIVLIVGIYGIAFKEISVGEFLILLMLHFGFRSLMIEK